MIGRNVADLVTTPHGRQGRPSEALTLGQAINVLARRLRAGESRLDHDLVLCTRNGKPLAAGNVRRAFRSITKAAGVGEAWTPGELRHTFVSIMSDNDVPIEKIADLLGHRATIVTQTVYRHQLRPVIETGAAALRSRSRRLPPGPGGLSPRR